MHRLTRILSGPTGLFLTVVGLAGLADDLATWANWMSSDLARWAFVLVGLMFIAYAVLEPKLPAVSVAVTRRAAPRSRRPPSEPQAAPSKKLVAKFPWFDAGQLVMRLYLGNERETQVPKGHLVCEIRTHAGDVVARSEPLEPSHGANWISDAHFPRDFPTTKSPLPVGGVYDAVWIVCVPLMRPGAASTIDWSYQDVEADRVQFRIDAPDFAWLPA